MANPEANIQPTSLLQGSRDYKQLLEAELENAEHAFWARVVDDKLTLLFDRLTMEEIAKALPSFDELTERPDFAYLKRIQWGI